MGMFADTRVVPNYFDELKDPRITAPDTSPGARNITSLQDNEQSWINTGSELRLNAGAVYDKRHTMFVEGDVYIANNIQYSNTGSYGNLADIPTFKLVVKGNIYIDKSVTRLDGVYIAQPRNDAGFTGGTIYTCSTGSTGTQQDFTDYYNECQNKLQVNGAFVAQDVKLLRTGNTLSSIDFGYSPASAGVSNANDILWADSAAEYSAATSGSHPFCTKIFETSEGVGLEWDDNYLCAVKDLQLRWVENSAANPAGAGEECTNWKVPDDNVYWDDNWLCAPTAQNLQIQFVVANSQPSIAGKVCTLQIEEPSDDWPGGSLYPGTTGGDPAARAYLCYAVSGAPESYTYKRETYGTDGAPDDEAAESLREGT